MLPNGISNVRWMICFPSKAIGNIIEKHLGFQLCVHEDSPGAAAGVRRLDKRRERDKQRPGAR
jgi:hypothetical protein